MELRVLRWRPISMVAAAAAVVTVALVAVPVATASESARTTSSKFPLNPLPVCMDHHRLVGVFESVSSLCMSTETSAHVP